MEREIELIRRLDTLKRELEIRYDFSPYAAFKTIDRFTEGAITTSNITLFLRGQGYYPTEREAISIIRRMDTSSAASISYSDFTDFLRGHGSADIYSQTSSPAKRTKSADRTSGSKRETLRDSLAKARSSSSIRTSPKRQSPKAACCSSCEKKPSACERVRSSCSPVRSCYPVVAFREPPVYCREPIYCREPVICRPASCFECPCRKYHSCRLDSCLCRCRLSSCSHPSCSCICRPCGPSLCSSKEYDLVKGLYDIIREERDLESAKINLAKRPDFNLSDAFKIFDTSSRGYVTLGDLRDGLAAIGVFPTTSDVELYIKRYDRFGERKIRFSEFSESLTPSTDPYTSSTLNRRRSNYFTSSRFSARDDCFEAGTRLEFRSAWNTHFKVEAMCEGIRQRLRALPCFDLYSAFLTCDLYNDGVISKDELKRLIDCRGFYVNDTDAKHLIDKMDRDRDGVVSYQEFREELEPKSFSFYRS